MSQPPLDSTPIGTNTTNVTTSNLDLTHIGTKKSYSKTLTPPTDLSKRKEKAHVTENQDIYPSLSDSSLSKYDSYDDRKYSKSKSKILDKKKKRQKHMKQDSSDLSSSNSDSSGKIDYRSKIRNKKKSHKKKDPIKLCTNLTAKLLTTAYKLNIITFKLDEDPLHRRIYFLTSVESLEMKFYQYKETCKVLLDYPKIGGDDIKDFLKKIIRNILHVNIDVHSRRLIPEFPGYGVKCIAELQSHCANINFSRKSRYDRIFQQVTHKGGESAMNYIKIFQNSQALSVSVGKNYSEYQVMHILLDKFHQGGKYSAQITSNQADLRRVGKFTDEKYLSISYL